MVANLAASLLEHERVLTTPAKAKEVRRFVEHLITYSKRDTLAERRKVLALLRHKRISGLGNKGEVISVKAIKKLFKDLGPRYRNRPGGYTRIIRVGGSRRGDFPVKLKYRLGNEARKLRLSGNRLGDNAEQVILELIQEENQASQEGETSAKKG